LTDLWMAERPKAHRCGSRRDRRVRRRRVWILLWERGQAHRKAWIKLLMSLSNSGSCFRRSSILRTEWMTVE
jgi:hypothetical protein